MNYDTERKQEFYMERENGDITLGFILYGGDSEKRPEGPPYDFSARLCGGHRDNLAISAMSPHSPGYVLEEV